MFIQKLSGMGSLSNSLSILKSQSFQPWGLTVKYLLSHWVFHVLTCISSPLRTQFPNKVPPETASVDFLLVKPGPSISISFRVPHLAVLTKHIERHSKSKSKRKSLNHYNFRKQPNHQSPCLLLTTTLPTWELLSLPVSLMLL